MKCLTEFYEFDL